MRLQGYLKDADSKRRKGDEQVAILVNQIREASYAAENAIADADYIEKRNELKRGLMGAISRYARLPGDLVTLHKVGNEIQRVKRNLAEIFQSAQNQKIDLDMTAVVAEDEITQDFGLGHQRLEDDFTMVGFQDEYREIMDKLVDEPCILTAVSIFAMGGAGKTTLARKLYNSSTVHEHFETVAWVTVSQKFKGVDLLKSIRKQLLGASTEIDQISEYEVGTKIRDFLLRKRYLIVLDDVWEDDTWDQINKTVKAFPDANNGSRVLLTTRKEKVANHVGMLTHVHVLKKLDEEKSWELFSSKALPSYRRSVIGDVGEFEELGRKLARKCDGLPLALAVLGGHLSKNLNIHVWEDVLQGWPSTKDIEMMREILARSYKDLPSHYFRSCFLYLATFPEDYIINVSDLIELWIAENFIPHTRKQEETARSYVAELAQRSLVQVTTRSRAHGWIEDIRIHDILRDWCIEEARQDGFLDVIDKNSGQVCSPSTDIMASYRSSYQDLSGDNLQAAPDLRSLIGFQIQSMPLSEVRYVRVLYIEKSRLKNFSRAIGVCIHLRCLKLIKCRDVTLPSSIGQLLYLQTIDMRDTHSLVPKELVPKSMWDIPCLRHVYLPNGFSPPRAVKQKELQTFHLYLRSASSKYCNLDLVRFLGQMTQLTTLRLKVLPHMPEGMMNIIANMPQLVDVELSDLSVHDELPESHNFPQNLRSLTLTTSMKQDPMPVLEKLQFLVVLKLYGYNGRTMSCSATGFPRLQELELSWFYHTEKWNIEAGAMPKLSSVLLERFLKMSRLPEGLLHLPSSNRLELREMPLISVEDDGTLMELQRIGCVIMDYI